MEVLTLLLFNQWFYNDSLANGLMHNVWSFILQVAEAKVNWIEEHVQKSEEAVRSALQKQEREWQQKLQDQATECA